MERPHATPHDDAIRQGNTCRSIGVVHVGEHSVAVTKLALDCLQGSMLGKGVRSPDEGVTMFGPPAHRYELRVAWDCLAKSKRLQLSVHWQRAHRGRMRPRHERRGPWHGFSSVAARKTSASAPSPPRCSSRIMEYSRHADGTSGAKICTSTQPTKRQGAVNDEGMDPSDPSIVRMRSHHAACGEHVLH